MFENNLTWQTWRYSVLIPLQETTLHPDAMNVGAGSLQVLTCSGCPPPPSRGRTLLEVTPSVPGQGSDAKA